MAQKLANPTPASHRLALTIAPETVYAGGLAVFTLTGAPAGVSPTWHVVFGDYDFGPQVVPIVPPVAPTESNPPMEFKWDTSGVPEGEYTVTADLGTGVAAPAPEKIAVQPRPLLSGEPLTVTMSRAAENVTSDAALWVVIRNSTNRLSFNNYVNAIDAAMCGQGVDCDDPKLLRPNQRPLSSRRALPFNDMDAYRILKIATECFLMTHCGVFLGHKDLQALFSDPTVFSATDEAARLNQGAQNLEDTLDSWWTDYLNKGAAISGDPADLMIPYLAIVRSRLGEMPAVSSGSMGIQCYGVLKRKLVHPCMIELIWSYWMEEGMLVQTLNAISRRFQNFRGPGQRDPLERFDIDPLRGLNNLLWGYVQDEQHRLTVVRRAYEYNHHYGLMLEGKAVRQIRPSDSRSKFLEAFHNLLNLCTVFYKEDDDTTVVADGFPVLNALKDTHYILAAGAANQFGELPSTARQEMMIQQWLLARPEMREFLGGKVMVPYPEEWMDRVDTVKAMKGWTDVSIIHFRDLAVYGEQIVLSIRYGAWSTVNNPAQAANWARYWRPEIQAYIYAYRAATGVDLTAEPVNATLPSVLLLKRLATQRPVAR
ncbi:MAG TPA: hypothetical protein VKX45_01870 [Bryobacteraceae bacterium]|jgi:hypothetical protein|nr:hypothetical protein [Bryobacteraceae bacterium]